jgi:hypothetical protein
MLLYSICYYYGKNKLSNIVNHLNVFSKIENTDKEFVLVCMVDSHDTNYFNEVEKSLSDFIIQHNNSVNFKILTSFNWGGTILGLWLTYNYGKIYNDDCYVAQFEEDFIPINDLWYVDAVNLLNDKTSNYIYIGEHIPPATAPLTKNNVKLFPKQEFSNIINKYCNSYYTNCCWTDGGFYFSTIKNFHIIEATIGIFHKGNIGIKYDHYVDGIVLGEVGFPTILYNNSFTFIGLHRPNYFIHNE